MATSIFSFVTINVIICFISLSPFPLLAAAASPDPGFTLNLIHRDSPLSPLYNPDHTDFDRLRNAFYRSISRANVFKTKAVDIDSFQNDLVPNGGEYFMKMSIGTPLVEVLVIADTGSDLTWVQCLPCDPCYRQKSPLFDPSRSSSYRRMLCGSRFCSALDVSEQTCAMDTNVCEYHYSYGDKSYTNGNLATEKFTIGSTSSRPVHLSPVVFGCGTGNGGTFDELGSGIVGLGGGALSLVSQLSSKIKGKFSYCLVPLSEQSNVTSKIKFGTDSVISGHHVVSTPLVSKQPETYYYVTLEAISVGNRRLPYTNGLLNGNVEEGNVIIDSGTTLTFLDSEFFTKLEGVVEETVKAERVSDPRGLFSVCFKSADDLDLPFITVHFTDADVKLQPLNTFVKADENLLCFTMIPSNQIGIFGNLAQMDFLVGYDLQKRTVSFKPTDCTKH
ncbi:ASPARTIC PROTEINASE CDR1-RELATED [Salix viminalis]|uniref:ASPARTIC PROTEINASE CDR1-RELATED n=1 Tax=Salix viminalis TaxID=40686 RepID=A0A6N2JYL4_SALVM|nr:ASPARTIC PROTEINASE CDR1-RELATED [Salix viminalis]